MQHENHAIKILLAVLIVLALSTTVLAATEKKSTSIFDKVKDVVKTVVDKAKEVISKIIPKPSPAVPAPTPKPAPAPSKNIIEKIIDGAASIVKNVYEAGKKIVTTVTNGIGSIINPSNKPTGGSGSNPNPIAPTYNFPSGGGSSGTGFTPSDSGAQYDYLSPDNLEAVRIYDTQLGSGEALWWNVDVADMALKCPSCPVIDGYKRETAGFTYVADVELVVQGNSPAQKAILVIKAESPNKEDFYEKRYTVSLPNGRFIYHEPLVRINVTPKTLNVEGDGDNEFDYKVTARLENDAGVAFPQRQVFLRTENRCSWYGFTYKCNLIQTKVVNDCCPGSDYCNQREYSSSANISESELGVGVNLDKCREFLVDDPSNDEKEKVFKLKKLSPDLSVRANIFI